MEDDSFGAISKALRTIVFCFCGFLILVIFLLGLIDQSNDKPPAYSRIADSPGNIYYMNYDVNTLGDSEPDRLVKYGYQLFVSTPDYIGPNAENTNLRFTGNGLSCNNCHLLAGIKAFAAPLIGIVNRFPQYRGREDKMGTIEERINGCMERSMNGVMMPETQHEMEALVAYLTWISRYSTADGKIEGQGFVNFQIPERPVNLDKGKQIFVNTCVECHGPSGQGKRKENSYVYEYPPLWGSNSYNNGAGMTRVITAAQFIKANMPFGTTYLNPKLTDDEAYDVAGYINQQQRPIKLNLEKDFPNLLKKPVSTPYPPYQDSFTMEQHQLGPFQPIMEYYLREYDVKKTK